MWLAGAPQDVMGDRVMGYVVAMPSRDGTQVLVEVSELPAGTETVSRKDDAVHAISETIEQSLETVKAAAEAIIDTLDRLVQNPSEATVEFGVKLGAKAGAIIVSAEAEAHLTITLKWIRSGSVAASRLDSEDRS